uniref:Major facilitator superfamily (MFS) profile domain-containing protein n=1 Tax=Corethron hystrix TaxID=216773 RepID=A0A7S1B7K2_9STRA|mmetsp:Transcript_16177/g.36392  ORF Transcript_16177/g.36392 Transcript_16177/m.36392 type:complete len:369 (+) Transcript_16177:102-1208(+)
MVSAEIIFALVSFSLGQLGDGLNIFQGIYLVGLGWNEGAVGIALSLMGFTALLIQPFAGDLVDKTRADRRTFLSVAALLTAGSAMAVMFVHEGNVDHWVIWITKIVEGLSSSFIGPCIAALTLASFGPDHFDSVMATNILFGHIGSVVAAVLAGSIAYYRYPDIKSCFYVIAASAFLAVIFVRFLPRGNDAMGRGFRKSADQQQSTSLDGSETSNTQNVASNYYTVLADRKTLVICLTGFFFHFANANVLLVLGEIMGGDNDDGSASRSAIPLIGAAIVTAQATMSIATVFGGRMTEMGIGRKPMFVLALATLPLRCALILLWQESSNTYLMLTQILDGIGGGFFGLIHPYMVADISFGTGRFNVLSE